MNNVTPKARAIMKQNKDMEAMEVNRDMAAIRRKTVMAAMQLNKVMADMEALRVMAAMGLNKDIAARAATEAKMGIADIEAIVVDMVVNTADSSTCRVILPMDIC